MAEAKRLKRAASSGWLVGCCAVAVSLLLGAQAFAVVTVTVDSTDGVQGGNLVLTWGVERTPTDPLVGGVQTDIVYDTTQIYFGGTCSNGGAACIESETENDAACGTCVAVPNCVPSTGVNSENFTADLPDTIRPPDQPPSNRLRLAVFGDLAHPNTTPTYEGELATCTFHVQANAQPGQQVSLVPSRVSASDTADPPDAIPTVHVTVSPGVIRMATPTPTATITPTPTPTIPCFVDQDCPRGQVCENKVCAPAPTPTPTIPCVQDQDCPDGLKCVANVCRDLSTPTPTPTHLPTCTTDQQCVDLEGPGFHCRSGVCVPERQCDDSNPDIDRKECRGVREACVDHLCECGGDCNLDGKVLGNETSIMTCVLRGQCELSDCPAGDVNGDGEITGSDLCLALSNLGLGCPGEGQPLVRDRTDETRSLDIGTATGIAGASVTLGVALGCPGPGCPAPNGADVATAQLDLLIDTSVLELPDVTKDCALAPGVPATEASYTYEPQTPETPPGIARLRLFVGNTDLCRPAPAEPPYPLTAFDQGPLVSCKFRINPNAQPGTYQVNADRLNVGDPQGAVFTSVFTAGSVTVQEPPACTSDSECPQGTHCRAGVCKPIVECTEFAQCGTSGRDSCVQGICECAGDCNLDGTVGPLEVAEAVQIFGEELPVNACPAADQKGDGQVTPVDVAVSVENFGLGCPTP